MKFEIQGLISREKGTRRASLSRACFPWPRNYLGKHEQKAKRFRGAPYSVQANVATGSRWDTATRGSWRIEHENTNPTTCIPVNIHRRVKNGAYTRGYANYSPPGCR
ncbi:unnamed protein product [Ectocarpus sp. 13 AM-2016]